MIRYESISDGYPLGYHYSKLIKKIFFFLNFAKAERSLKDLVLPEVITHKQYLSTPSSDFFGKHVSVNGEKTYAQVFEDSSPKISVIDLARTYKKVHNKSGVLLIFGYEDEFEVSYYFIRPDKPFDLVLESQEVRFTKDQLEWEKPDAIPSKLKYLLDVYSGYTDKIVFIGSKKSRFFDSKSVEFIKDGEIKELFDLTPPMLSKEQSQNLILKQYFFYFFLPLAVVGTLSFFVPDNIISSIEDKNKELKVKRADKKKDASELKKTYSEMIEAIQKHKEVLK